MDPRFAAERHAAHRGRAQGARSDGLPGVTEDEAGPRPFTIERVSVIIPCLNAAETLDAQLEALRRQTWRGEIEVLVADNGSTDGSSELAASWRDRLPGLRVIPAADRKGPAHARNVAAAAATGDVLLFCDADDEVAEGWIDGLVPELERHEAAASRHEIERLNGEQARRLHGDPAQQYGLCSYTNPPFLDHAGGCGLGIRRHVFECLGGFDEEYVALEDTDLCWRLQLGGYSLVFAPEAVVHVRFPAALQGAFRQAVRYGQYNVYIYTRYRSCGMPRLQALPGVLRLGSLLLRSPQVLSKSKRGRWIWLAGWRLGRLQGCLRYRTIAF
ncbi:MAG: glycosyltransferase [Holophagales bacterium]|nr:glycosyltransferase [Holophagales bacterium]MYH24704.1 glycosyltransferase [Holophagales bacterium]